MYSRSESCNRIPTWGSRESRSATALVTALGDVVQNARMGIQGRIDEANRALSNIQASLVDLGQDASECWTTGAGAIDEPERAVNSDNIVCSIRRDIRNTTSHLRVIEAIGTIWGRVIGKPMLDSGCLVTRQGEHVAESATTVDHSLTGFFGLSTRDKIFDDIGVVLNLCCSNR